MTSYWATTLNLSGIEFILVRADWPAVKNPRDRPLFVRKLESIFPGKHIVIATRDPLSKNPGADFFGAPPLVAFLAGHKLADFPWREVKAL
jgi:hypothetical protein